MSDVSVLFITTINQPMKNYWTDSSFFNTSQQFIDSCNRNVYNEAFLLNPEESYSFRNQQTFATKSIHTVHYGSNSSSYPGPKLLIMVPSDVKSLETAKAFKFGTKKRVSKNWPYSMVVHRCISKLLSLTF